MNTTSDLKYSEEDMRKCDENAYWRGVQTSQQQILSQVNRDKNYDKLLTRLSFEDYIKSLDKIVVP